MIKKEKKKIRNMSLINCVLITQAFFCYLERLVWLLYFSTRQKLNSSFLGSPLSSHFISCNRSYMKPVDTASFCLEISPVDPWLHQVPFLFSMLTAGSSINKAATFPSASKVIFLSSPRQTSLETCSWVFSKPF